MKLNSIVDELTLAIEKRIASLSPEAQREILEMLEAEIGGMIDALEEE